MQLQRLERIKQAAISLNIPAATLRDLRFWSRDHLAADGTVIPGNGFAPAFVTLGRSVYVDIYVFNAVWHATSEQRARVALQERSLT